MCHVLLISSKIFLDDQVKQKKDYLHAKKREIQHKHGHSATILVVFKTDRNAEKTINRHKADHPKAHIENDEAQQG